MQAAAEDLSFLRPNRPAVLITRRRDGGLQSSLVRAVGHPDGEVLVWARAGTAKVHNLARDPRAAICAMSDDFSTWLHVEGTAEVIRLPQAMALLEEYHRLREGAEHSDWPAYRQRMQREQRVLLRIRPERLAKPPAR